MAKIKTAPLLGEFSGALGNVAFRRSRYGTQMVERQTPRDPRTPAQQDARQRMTRVGQAWRGMSVEQAAKWRAYAEQQIASSLEPSPVPSNLFSRLALRVLQVNPSAEIPLLPPTVPFGGDGVQAVLGSEAGRVVLQIQRGNSPGVVTEVLLQPLASVHRATYLSKYRSRGFSSWVAGGSVSVPVRAGVYAVAIRVVEAATGQSGGILELGRVVVS